MQRARERVVPITAARGLNGLFSDHFVILIKPCTLSYSYLHRNREGTGDEIDHKKKVTRRCLCTYSHYHERSTKSRGKLESDIRIFNSSFTDSKDLKVELFPSIILSGQHFLTSRACLSYSQPTGF